MPHRCSNSWAWWRVAFRALKPSKNTQLVIHADLKYMNPDGSMCHVSVRRLTIDLDLNKDTIVASDVLRADISSQSKNTETPDPNQLNERLRTWLESSKHVQKYLHDPQALASLTPLGWRFPGYEGVIRQWCANLRKNG